MAEVSMADYKPSLPPGFRFHPTDGEVIGLLHEKIHDPSYNSVAIAEVDLNKNEPSELPGQAKMGEKEFFFYCQKGKKYPSGTRTNRATGKGYWKATGKDKEIFEGKTLIGMKKTLVFYTGRAPRGEKTNWIMHEFRLEGDDVYSNLPRGAKDSWVVCKVFNKNVRSSTVHDNSGESSSSQLVDPQYMFNPTSSDQEFLIGAPASSSSVPPPNSSTMEMIQLEKHQDHNYSTTLFSMDANNYQAMYYSQTPVMVNQNNSFYLGSANMGDMHQNQTTPTPTTILGSIGGGASSAIRAHCKAEQLSHNSTMSPDKTLEISSISSGHTDLDCFTSDFINNIWDY